MEEPIRANEALTELRDRGFSAWLGWDNYSGRWCVQVKPRTENLHELVYGDSPDAAAEAALSFVKTSAPIPA